MHDKYRVQTAERSERIRLEELTFQQKLEKLSPFYRSIKKLFQEAEKVKTTLERRLDVLSHSSDRKLSEQEKMEYNQLYSQLVELKKRLAEYEKKLTSLKPMERNVKTHPSLPLFSSYSILKPMKKWEQWLEEFLEIKGYFSKFSFSPSNAQIRYNGKILLQFESPRLDFLLAILGRHHLLSL